MEVSEAVKKDIDTRVTQLNARLEQNLKDIAEHQAIIDRLTEENVKLEELKAGYNQEVVANISVKAVKLI